MRKSRKTTVFSPAHTFSYHTPVCGIVVGSQQPVCWYDRVVVGLRPSGRCSMNRPLLRCVPVLFILVVSLTLISCGTSSNRVLESISVSPQTGSGQVQYVATGTFSAPPLTITPLPVNWCVKLAPLASPGICGPPGNSDPGITSQGLATCGTSTLGATVTALAPSDPKLPLNAQGVPMVSGSSALNCP